MFYGRLIAGEEKKNEVYGTLTEAKTLNATRKGNILKYPY